MNDLTVIYYTANKNNSHFMGNTQRVLLEAIGDLPIVTVSFKPTIIGDNCNNIVIGEQERSGYMLYKQVLTAAQNAKTEYVATAEDDMLYTPGHFDYRPKGDVFAYNINKWSIFSWINPPIFSYRPRKLMNSLIVKRELLVKCLEERYKKYNTYDPESFKALEPYWGEPGRVEGHLGLTHVESEEFESELPNIMFSAKEALGFKYLGTRKAHSKIKADYVEGWGTAEDVLKLYNE